MTKISKEAIEQYARIIAIAIHGKSGDEYMLYLNASKIALESYESDLQNRVEVLERLYKSTRGFAQAKVKKCHKLYTALAPRLGLKPFYGTCNKQQVIWAKSQDDANSLMAGENIYKYVDEALNQCEASDA